MFGPIHERQRKAPTLGRAATGSALPPAGFQKRGVPGGTRVATDRGWRPVETLAIGAMVQTLDHGLQPLRALTRATQAGRPADRLADPIHVPAGALDNTEPMVVLPEQYVGLAYTAAHTRFVLIPAKALVGHMGIARFRPLRAFDVFTLHFDADEVVTLDGGARTLTRAAPASAADALGTKGAADTPAGPMRYATWSAREARALVALLASNPPAAPHGQTLSMKEAA